MKELSIEEKAQRYDEALEKSKRLYEQGTITESLAYIFPELKESEDEKIRKGLIYYFTNFHLQTFAGIDPKKIIAWLEKQYADPIKEYWRGYNEGKQNILDKYAELEKQAKQPKQDNSDVNDYNNIDPHFGKPIDKIEPKFKVGDWVTIKE